MAKKSKTKVVDGSQTTKKTKSATTQKVSSADSTNHLTTSPPSVPRRIRPDPVQPDSRNIRPRLEPPIAPTPRDLALNGPHAQVSSIPRANSTNQVEPNLDEAEEEEEEEQEQGDFGHAREEEEEEEHDSDEEDDDEGDDEATEGLYVTLQTLLTAPGRDAYCQMLSPHIGQGTW